MIGLRQSILLCSKRFGSSQLETETGLKQNNVGHEGRDWFCWTVWERLLHMVEVEF